MAKIEGIPYVSQWEQGGNLSIGDCGIASVAMLAHWLGRSETIDQIILQAGLPYPRSTYSFAEVIQAGKKVGVQLSVHQNFGVNELKQAIDAGKPVIPLVWYPAFTGNQISAAAHFFVVIGYDEAGVTVHDSNYLRNGGANRSIPWAEYEQSIGPLLKQKSGNNAYQAMVMENPLSTKIAITPMGMNIDVANPGTLPDPQYVKGMVLRYPLKIRFAGNSLSVENTLAFYKDKLSRYVDAGCTLIAIVTHQTYGEGAGFNWPSMLGNAQAWTDYAKNLNVVLQVAVPYLVQHQLADYFQIWNEPDTPPANARAAVPLTAADYGVILSIIAPLILQHQAKLITAGLVSGPANGSTYIRQALQTMESRLNKRAVDVIDGIGVHSYGRGDPAYPAEAGFGDIWDDLNTYYPILNKPVWITEWGVLDNPKLAISAAAKYVNHFMDRCLMPSVAHKLASAIWYAWRDGMDNGYGIADSNNEPKAPLLTAVRSYVKENTVTTPHDYGALVTPASIIVSPDGVNTRKASNTGADKVKLLKNGDIVGYYPNPVQGGSYTGGNLWYKLVVDGKEAYAAASFIQGFNAITSPAIHAPLTSDEMQQLINQHSTLFRYHLEQSALHKQISEAHQDIVKVYEAVKARMVKA